MRHFTKLKSDFYFLRNRNKRNKQTNKQTLAITIHPGERNHSHKLSTHIL